MKKKIVASVIALLMLLLCACSNSAPATAPTAAPAATEAPKAEQAAPAEQAKAEEPAPAEEPAKAEEPVPAEVPAKVEESAPAEASDASADTDTIKLQGPFLMTTCGQSTGSVMAHVAAVQAKVTSKDEHQLLASEVPELGAGAKTLVVTTGTSGKGMGAAGTDVDDEISRCKAVIEAARAQGMCIVVAHIEGMSRRTDSSDQASIENMLPLADIIVCVEESNSDNLFSDYAAAHNIPILVVPEALSLSGYMYME